MDFQTESGKDGRNMQKLKKGYYTALGTPLDEKGNILAEELIKHIEMQIEAKASGLLLMGSMGIEAAVKHSAYAEIVKIAVGAVNGRVPLFVGAMDNSIARVLERIELIKDYPVDGIVLTTPFYASTNEKNLVQFFTKIADQSPFPVYLYDLPTVTKQKITFGMIEKMADHPNIAGIKTADIPLCRLIQRSYPEFEVLCSNLDAFDMVLNCGIDKVLDGMFSCMPVNSEKFIQAAWDGDMEACGKYLDNILKLRNTFIAHGVLYSFTQAMHLLGFAGDFHYDYDGVEDGGAAKAHVEAVMKEVGEL